MNVRKLRKYSVKIKQTLLDTVLIAYLFKLKGVCQFLSIHEQKEEHTQSFDERI